MAMTAFEARELVRRKAGQRYGAPFDRESGPYTSWFTAQDRSRRVIVRLYNNDQPGRLGWYTLTKNMVNASATRPITEIVFVDGNSRVSVWIPVRWLQQHWDGDERPSIKFDGVSYYWGSMRGPRIDPSWVVRL